MQRILEQKEELRGDENTAKKKAKYLWHKDEVAYHYCMTIGSVERVKFTGERWIVGNAWGYRKIYQFEVLGSSSCLRKVGEITHDEEYAFFETLESTCDEAIRHINRMLEFHMTDVKKTLDSIRTYRKSETTFKKEIITEKVTDEK